MPPPERSMRLFDWLVVTVVFLAITNAIYAFITRGRALELVAPAFAVVGWPLFLIWVWMRGGANSPLWRWLPPFYPWGTYFTTVRSRQVFVTALVVFAVAWQSFRR